MKSANIAGLRITFGGMESNTDGTTHGIGIVTIMTAIMIMMTTIENWVRLCLTRGFGRGFYFFRNQAPGGGASTGPCRVILDFISLPSRRLMTSFLPSTLACIKSPALKSVILKRWSTG
jgi:hypothetical protein